MEEVANRKTSQRPLAFQLDFFAEDSLF